MFIILSYQSSNPELFCYTFALKTVLHQTKDHVTSNPVFLTCYTMPYLLVTPVGSQIKSLTDQAPKFTTLTIGL